MSPNSSNFPPIYTETFVIKLILLKSKMQLHADIIMCVHVRERTMFDEHTFFNYDKVN